MESSENRETYNFNSPIIDSGASVSMFCSKLEAEKGTYRNGSRNSAALEAGNTPADCIGEGTISLGNMELPDYTHVESLNGALLSEEQICDQNKLVDLLQWLFSVDHSSIYIIQSTHQSKFRY